MGTSHRATVAPPGVYPADLLAVAGHVPYAVTVDWSRHGASGAFDVVFSATTPGAPPRPRARGVGATQASWVRTARRWGRPAAGWGRACASRSSNACPRTWFQRRSSCSIVSLSPKRQGGPCGAPPPDFARPELGEAYAAPRTPLEGELARAWSEGLRVQQVGINDNFFELGGDSIISIHLVARANQAGIALTPKLLFEHPTIAQIAAAPRPACGHRPAAAGRWTVGLGPSRSRA